ncbi:hypothetical protein GO986_08770 [Deinococcus sp. HMF7620]|uniref:Copper amine oxidase-like N-terminal domain-containing protein n=1 Tax=Deinococcus arboris TaxID=2682977 RepID=A0A7C9HZB3_9DEIO|nr:hypothetical protein [Deinococcus arboris]MVN86855.1 hypothetical protein [Deinococcus arboris]
MKKLVATVLFSLSAFAAAQPSSFTGSTVRDDIAKRIGAYERSCKDLPVAQYESAYSYCMFTEGSFSRAKSIIDIYYEEYLTGGWKISDGYIYNFLKKEDRSLRVTIKELDGYTFVAVADLSLADQIRKEEAHAGMQSDAAKAGATPNSAYVWLSDLRSLGITVQAKPFSITYKSQKLDFNAASRSALLNKRAATLNATPFLLDGSILFPVAALRGLGCEVQAPTDKVVGVSCGGLWKYLNVYVFQNKNAPASTLTFPKIQTPLQQSPTASGQAPTSSTASAASVNYAPLNLFGSLGTVSTRGSAQELTTGGRSITFSNGQRQTPQGFNLPGVPFFDGGELFIPIDSLKFVGCTVEFDNLDYQVTCPNGESVIGVGVVVKR